MSLINFCHNYALKILPGGIVLIGGLSKSGKTTLANDLRDAILQRGLTSYTISIDRWIRSVELRMPGVLGRYDLSTIRNVITNHSNKRTQNLNLPQYDKMQQCTIDTNEYILINPTDILIVEGVLALTLENHITKVDRLYVTVDELIRKQRVINEYLSRGKVLKRL